MREIKIWKLRDFDYVKQQIEEGKLDKWKAFSFFRSSNRIMDGEKNMFEQLLDSGIFSDDEILERFKGSDFYRVYKWQIFSSVELIINKIYKTKESY